MSKKTLEIEDKTIDDAIEKACREFGVFREKLNIEIISESSGGFFGVLSRKAKIKASLLSFDMDFNLADDPKPKSEHRIKIEPRPEVRIETQVKRREETLSVIASEPVSVSDYVPEATPEQLSQIKELLSGILNRMSFDCQVCVEETPEKIILTIEGDDSGLLIGRRGQNLDALQYIINKAINKSDNNRKMITVDSETYRKRREDSLLELAKRVKEKVKKSQKPISLAHMNAHDRRIIHMALKEDDSLVTKSRGEGEYRKIVVLPARKGKIKIKAKNKH